MKKLLETIERTLDAITFAEAGEWDTARGMLPASRPKGLGRLERVFMAAAYAEEGLHEEALRVMRFSDPAPFDMNEFFSAVGLKGASVRVGVLNA